MDMAISTRTSLQSPDDYEKQYKAMHPSSRGSNLYGAFAFDAVLSIAVTLNKSIELLNGTRLEDFTYERADMTALFKNLLETTVFDGLTVRGLHALQCDGFVVTSSAFACEYIVLANNVI